MSYKTLKRVIIGIYIVGVCFVLSIPLLMQKRDPTVYIPSWVRAENGSSVRPYDIINDSYGYKSIIPVVLIGSIFYILAAAVFLAEKASDEALEKPSDKL